MMDHVMASQLARAASFIYGAPNISALPLGEGSLRAAPVLLRRAGGNRSVRASRSNRPRGWTSASNWKRRPRCWPATQASGSGCGAPRNRRVHRRDAPSCGAARRRGGRRRGRGLRPAPRPCLSEKRPARRRCSKTRIRRMTIMSRPLSKVAPDWWDYTTLDAKFWRMRRGLRSKTLRKCPGPASAWRCTTRSKISIWPRRWSTSPRGGNRRRTIPWAFAARSGRRSSCRLWRGWSTSWTWTSATPIFGAWTNGSATTAAPCPNRIP